MIQKLHLTQVFVNEEQDMKSRDGRSFKSCRTAIKAKEYGDKWLSGFAQKATADKLKEQVKSSGDAGHEIELEITESDKLDKEGKPYTNWKFVNKEVQQASKLAQIEFSVAKHDLQIKELQEAVKKLLSGERVEVPKAKVAGTDIDYPTPASDGGDDINPDDIPW